MKRNFFGKLEGPWDLDLAGHLTNGSLSNAFSRFLADISEKPWLFAVYSCPGCGSFLHSGRHRCAVSSYSTCSIKSNFHLRSSRVPVRWYCMLRRTETSQKLMSEVCCNGRPGKLTHLYVQRLALNAQRSLGHLPLAQKSKKPWAGLTGNGWDLGVEWDNSHVKNLLVFESRVWSIYQLKVVLCNGLV